MLEMYPRRGPRPRHFLPAFACDRCDGSDDTRARGEPHRDLGELHSRRGRPGARQIARRGDPGDQHVVLAGHEHLAVVLLEVLAIERHVLDEQAELGLPEVLYPRAVDELAVDVARVRQAEDHRAARREVVLDDLPQHLAIVDAGALQGVQRDHQVESAEPERGERADVRLDEPERGEPRARDRERRGAVIDADHVDPGQRAHEQRELVAGVDAQVERPRARAEPGARDRLAEIDHEARVLELGDPRIPGARAVALGRVRPGVGPGVQPIVSVGLRSTGIVPGVPVGRAMPAELEPLEPQADQTAVAVRGEQAQPQPVRELDPHAKRAMDVQFAGVLDLLAGVSPAAEIRIEHAERERRGAGREARLDERDDVEQRLATEHRLDHRASVARPAP